MPTGDMWGPATPGGRHARSWPRRAPGPAAPARKAWAVAWRLAVIVLACQVLMLAVALAVDLVKNR